MKPSQPLCKPRLRTVLTTCLLAVAFPLTALMSTAGVMAVVLIKRRTQAIPPKNNLLTHKIAREFVLPGG